MSQIKMIGQLAHACLFPVVMCSETELTEKRLEMSNVRHDDMCPPCSQSETEMMMVLE